MKSTLDEAKKLNPIFKEYDFSLDEIKIYGMARLFEAMAKKYKHYQNIFKKDQDPRTAKYWVAFQKLKEKIGARPINLSLFYKAQFKNSNSDKIIPHFLHSDMSFKRYKDYMKQFKEEKNSQLDFTKLRCKELYKTYKFINEYLSDHNMQEGNYEAFFTYTEDFNDYMPIAFRFSIQGYLSKFYLAISKSFGEAYMIMDEDIRDEIITKDELIKKRQEISQYPEIREYAELKFGKEEIGFWKWSKK